MTGKYKVEAMPEGEWDSGGQCHTVLSSPVNKAEYQIEAPVALLPTKAFPTTKDVSTAEPI